MPKTKPKPSKTTKKNPSKKTQRKPQNKPRRKSPRKKNLPYEWSFTYEKTEAVGITDKTWTLLIGPSKIKVATVKERTWRHSAGVVYHSEYTVEIFPLGANPEEIEGHIDSSYWEDYITNREEAFRWALDRINILSELWSCKSIAPPSGI